MNTRCPAFVKFSLRKHLHDHWENCQQYSLTYYYFFSFSVTKATLELQMSVCLSVCNKNPSASQNCSYWPSSVSTIEPINHQDHWPSSLSTSGLLLRLSSLLACSLRIMLTFSPPIHFCFQIRSIPIISVRLRYFMKIFEKSFNTFIYLFFSALWDP